MDRETKKALVYIIFLYFIAVLIFIFFNGSTKIEKNTTSNEVKNSELNAKQKRAQLKQIKYIYQKSDELKNYECSKDGEYLNGDFSVHGCMVVNFVMVNNAINDKKSDVAQMYQDGYSCHLDFERVKKEYQYRDYVMLDYSSNFIKDMNYRFSNKNNVIDNNQNEFTIKDSIDQGIPLMVWMVPNKDKKLNKGHLITIYDYKVKNNKIEYYFYDTYNKKTPSRKLSEFMKRWKIAQIHILVK